ncbi:MAG: hypothetical protein DWQ04_10160 [Chloroflexi bacterium]|nr:MAG: hypothetical protein DWQ04_10160 [Chloroflexota bacterium]
MSDYSKDTRRRSRSMFGPIVLIAVGVYFLLSNLGMVSSPNWAAVFQLWPLWLIFAGVNIIVQQAPRPFGGFLSAVVGVTAVALFGYVLLFSEDNALLTRLGVRSTPNVETIDEDISFRPEDASSALVEIDFNSAGANLFTLEDNNDLIAGTVTYTGDLILETDQSGDRATVYLDTKANDDWGVWFNPSNWNGFEGGDRWQLGLNPNYEMELRLNSSSGSINADLSELSLTYLELDSASGSIDMAIPEGEYDVDVNAASGSLEIVFPENGRLDTKIDGASGSITLLLPEGMEAQVEIEDGSGSFRPDGRFDLIDGERDGDGTWQTANYEDASNRVTFKIDVASGSVRIDTP